MSKKVNKCLVMGFLLLLTSGCGINAQIIITSQILATEEEEYRKYLGNICWQLSWVPNWILVSTVKARGLSEEEAQGARILKNSLLRGDYNCSQNTCMQVQAFINRFEQRCKEYGCNLDEKSKKKLFNEVIHEFQLDAHHLPRNISFQDFADKVQNDQVDVKTVSDILFVGLFAKYIVGLSD